MVIVRKQVSVEGKSDLSAEAYPRRTDGCQPEDWPTPHPQKAWPESEHALSAARKRRAIIARAPKPKTTMQCRDTVCDSQMPPGNQLGAQRRAIAILPRNRIPPHFQNIPFAPLSSNRAPKLRQSVKDERARLLQDTRIGGISKKALLSLHCDSDSISTCKV